jgi:ferredoxin-nitrite reductase
MLEVYPLIEQMQAHFLNRPEWMGMIPRKFNTAITATHASGMHFFGNDLFFAPAKKDNLNGFNVYLGGKNSHTARCADIFVLPHEVPEMFLSIAKAYSRHGLRGSRAKTRLFHLLASISMAQFRAYVAAIYSKPIRSAGTLQLQKYHAKQLETLKDGSFGLRIHSRYGRIDTQTLTKIVAFAKEQGAQIRLGADQNIYLVGLKERQHPFSKSEHAQITACAGSHFCALSLWDIKAETSYLPQHLLHKYNISVGFSGCLKGCGRHHHADIGLVGLRTNLFGPVIKAARLFLGSEYTQTQKPARLIYHVVPLEKLSALIEVIVDEFLSSLEADFEDFSRNHLNRYSSEFLMLWFLSKLYLKEKIAFEGREESELYALLKEREDFPKVEEKPDSYEEAVRVLMHTLWDVSQKEA